MNSMSDKNKLKLAEAMYILVIVYMVCLVVSDSLRYGNIKNHIDNSSKSVLNNIQASEQFNTYNNLKYGFKIDYPRDFVMLSDDMNGSGASFLSKDKLIKLTVYGFNNVPYEPIEMLYKKDLSVIDGDVKHKYINKQWYEITWIKNHIVYYRKVYVGTEALNSIIFSYPENSLKINNSILDNLLKSFKPGNLESSH